jgi:Flp pilus assembly protein TadB
MFVLMLLSAALLASAVMLMRIAGHMERVYRSISDESHAQSSADRDETDDDVSDRTRIRQ